ncbi:MAG: Panacea domain-containing protein [Anaerolineales bacterium]
MTAKELKRRKIVADDEKFKELILYIAIRSEGDNYFGAKKLNKLLFFADFLAYLNFGEPITGQDYQALQFGPAPRRLLPIRREMEQAKDIALRKQEFYTVDQHRIFALREPDLRKFKPEEIDLVNRLIAEYWDMKAGEIEALSHKFLGWEVSNYKEIIPYETALVSTRKLTDDEREFGKTLQPLAEKYLAMA